MTREVAAPAAAQREADGRLRAWRTTASAHSAGRSGDVIYAAVERLLAERGAHGDLLDFGAGTVALARRLLATERLRSIPGADLLTRPEDLAEGITWVHADLNDVVSLPAASFDLIVAAEVIEHLENPRAAARELFRRLRPGDRAAFDAEQRDLARLIRLVVGGHFASFGDSRQRDRRPPRPPRSLLWPIKIRSSRANCAKAVAPARSAGPS